VTRSPRAGRDEAFSAFVLARQGHLRAIAYSLCGDWHEADDLLQTALTKLYVAWPRVTRDGSPEAYVRRILVHANIDDHRRRSRRLRTVSLETGPDVPGRATIGPEDTSAMVDALQALPEQQRKVVVLRHWLGLSVRETATELGINEGTVKSHSSRGLAALEAALSPQRHG
jgi:RNA polymerase sigma-70 factor (sigma-E family)